MFLLEIPLRTPELPCFGGPGGDNAVAGRLSLGVMEERLMGNGFQLSRTLLVAVVAVFATLDQCRAQSACQDARLTASDPGVFESFGYSVAVSGDTVVVGADWDSELGTQAGAAYVFRRKGMMWAEMQKLLGSDQVAGDQFGHSVATDGSVAMIGSLQHIHDGAPGTGAVYAFRFDSDAEVWTEEQEVLTATGAWGDGFGEVVSLSNDLMLVSARFDDVNGGNAGAAFIFRFDPETSQWVEEQKLLASDGEGGDFFGTSVAISGDIAVIGADGHDDGAEEAGAAYVFRYDSRTSTWLEEQKLLASDAASHDRFGSSVSISGETVLIGATGNFNFGISIGSAYVFGFDTKTSNWVQEQELLPSDDWNTDQFGKAVALDGDAAVIGAPFSDAIGSSSGAAYVFRFDGSSWLQQQALLPDPNPWANFFGWSVAIDGDKVIAGAFGEDQQRGATYIYDVAPNCNCPHDLDADGSIGVSDLLSLLADWGPCEGCPGDFDGDGTVGLSDLLALLANWGACP